MLGFVRRVKRDNRNNKIDSLMKEAESISSGKVTKRRFGHRKCSKCRQSGHRATSINCPMNKKEDSNA